MDNNHLSEENLQKVFATLHGEDKNICFVELDDEVEFNCNRCGSCCTHREDIVLSPYDVYDLAVALKKSGREIVNEYCAVHIGHSSHLPVVVIADTPEHKCPFLKFDASEMLYGCSVNDHKPGPCLTHPFGVVRSMNAQTLEPEELRFIKTDFCDMHSGGNKKTVREFIGEKYFETLNERAVSYKLQSFVTKLLNLKKIHAIIETDKSFEGFTDEEREILSVLPKEVITMSKILYTIPYLENVYNFDYEKPFLEQAESGLKALVKESIEKIALFKILGFDVTPSNEKEYDDILNRYMTEEEIEQVFKEFEEGLSRASELRKRLLEECDNDADTTGN